MTETQRYRIIERIAAGGMAEVYQGESAGIEGFRKKVAIKRVLPKLSQNHEFIHMFLDEARLCAYLSHSKCVQVFDIGQAAGAHFIVMEYVDGADLQGLLEHLQRHSQRMPVEVACLIAMHVCEGLAYAHDARDHNDQPLGIVHRDVSPHNVLITRFGEVKLVDFGLARASSHLSAEEEDIVRGKFGYLAPEVTLGLGADRRVDIFAAGILLWEMLAGRRLFKGETDVETFKQARAAEVPDVRQLRPEVGVDLTQVLGRALARDREQRYQRADDFAKDLAVVLTGLGKPVTYQDLAQLVVATSGERSKSRRVEQRDAAGMMGDLILDALHDFSGAGSQASAGAVGARSEARPEPSADFVNPSEWGLDALFDDSPGPAPTVRSAAAPLPAGSASSRSAVESPPSGTAAQRARPQAPPRPPEGGPFWRRWFGG